MKRQKNFTFGVILVLILAALIYTAWVKDPVYAGKRFSEHLKAFDHCGLHHAGLDNFTEPSITFNFSNNQARDLAYEAVDQVGTDALPLLVYMLKAKDNAFGMWIEKMANKYPLIRKLIPPKSYNAGALRIRAIVAFSRLGQRGAPAIPQIIPLLQDPECAIFAAFALKSIGPKRECDLLSLTNALRITTTGSNQPPISMTHSILLLLLASFGTNAVGATPIFLSFLNATNAEVQAAAAVALVKIGAPAENVVPFIIQNLEQINSSATSFMPTRGAARGLHLPTIIMLRNLWSLKEYGGRARMALPILTNLQSFPISNIQRAAQETAERIRMDADSIPR